MHISERTFTNKAIVYFFLFVITVAGVVSFFRMSKLEDPAIQIKKALVITTWPGATSHEMELQVTDILEREIRSMGDVDEITSRSLENYSEITVDIKQAVPNDELQQRWDILRRRVENAQSKLPQGVNASLVFDDFGDVYGMFYAITSDGIGMEELNNNAKFCKVELQKIPEVSRVQIYGNISQTVSIEFSQDVIKNLNISLAEILLTLKDQNKVLYPGTYLAGDEKISLRVNGGMTDIESIRNTVLHDLEKKQVRLGDIAKVYLSESEGWRNKMKYNGSEALGILISMQKGDNVIELGKKVETRLGEILERMPAGVGFEKIFFQPERVNKAISQFMINLLQSVAIVIVVLVLTMGIRSGLIIGSGLIFTILASLPILTLFGGTLQRVSLGAFILAMGMLVDNSIVVIDGILIDLQKGVDRKKAMVRSAKKNSTALFIATLIAICSFLPVYLSPDTAGTYVKDLFLVLCISLTVSWLLSMTQIPLFSSHFLKLHKNHKKGEAYQGKVYTLFKKLLTITLHNRTITIGITLALLAISMVGFTQIKRSFFPNFEYDQFYVEYKLPEGTDIARVEHDLDSITAWLLQQPDVKNVNTSMGGTVGRYCLVRTVPEISTSYGELIVDFTNYKAMQDMIPKIRQYLMENYPQAYARVRQYNITVVVSHLVEVQFSGPDPQILKNLSAQAQTIFQDNPHIDKTTLKDDWEPKRKVLSVAYDQNSAKRVGVNRSDISNALLASTGGLPIGHYYEGHNKYPLMMKVRQNSGKKLENLNDAPVWSMIPRPSINKETLRGVARGYKSLDDVEKELFSQTTIGAATAGITMQWEEPVVRRDNGTRTIKVQADPMAGYTATQCKKEIKKGINSIELPPGYSREWRGEAYMQKRSMRYIIMFIPIAFFLMVTLLILMFKDYKKPVIILASIPLSLIGIVPGMLITGKDFGFVAICGMLGLMGMMIKNGIVLIEEIEDEIKNGEEPHHAIFHSAISRMRPVSMASLTTILGMIPLIGDAMFGSMAVTIMSGLLVGTVITLFLIPVLYSVLYKISFPKNLPASLLSIVPMLVLLIPLTTFAEESVSQTLSIKECRILAVKNSNERKISENERMISKEQKTVARSFYFPKVKLNGMGSATNSPISIGIEGGYLPTFSPAADGSLQPNQMVDPTTGAPVFDGSGNPVFTDYAYMPETEINLVPNFTFNVGLLVEQPIYMGGKIAASNRMAEIGMDMREKKETLTIEEDIIAADSAYWLLVSVKGKLVLAQEYFTLLDSLEKSVSDAYAAGMKTRNDLLEVQMKKSEAAYKKAKAKNGITLATMHLCQVVGLPLKSIVDVEEFSPSALPTLLEESSNPISEIVENRIEYKLHQKNVELKEQDIKLERSEFLPNLAAVGSLGYFGYDFDNTQDGDLFLVGGVNLSVPLFTWGERRSKINIKRRELEISSLKAEEASEMIELEIAKIKTELNNAVALWESASLTMLQSEENLASIKESYNVGLESINTLLEAQVKQQQAASAQLDATMAYQLAKSCYDKATGQL
jgi:multidrug efflux pump subunit AcrB/outer membrane protein TolC